MSENKKLRHFAHQLQLISDPEKLRTDHWLLIRRLASKRLDDRTEQPLPPATQSPRGVADILTACPSDVFASLAEGLAHFGFAPLPASTTTVTSKGVSSSVSLAIKAKTGDESAEDRLVVAVKKQPLSGTGFQSVWIETTILRSCSHPNIARFLGHFYVRAAGESGESKNPEKMNAFMLMEYASAGDLRMEMQRFLPSKSMPEAHARFYAYHVMQGLHYLHSRSIEYGDLHAANVQLRYNCDFSKTPVLSDFRLSRIVASATTTDQTPFSADVRQAVDLIRILVTGSERENVPIAETVSPSAKKLLTTTPPATVSQLILAEWFAGPSEPFIEAPPELRELPVAVSPRKPSENKQLRHFAHQLQLISDSEKLRPNDWMVIRKMTDGKSRENRQEQPLPSSAQTPHRVTDILTACPSEVVSNLTDGLAHFGFVPLPASTRTRSKGVCGQISLAIKAKTSGDESVEDRLVIAVKKQPVRETGYRSVWIETSILRSCSHPNIVRFLGHFYVSPPSISELEEAKRPEKMTSFTLMEYANAGDLENELYRFLPSKSMPEAHARFYAYHVMQGLHYLHSRSIEYGDLHAANVLLRYNSDFSKTPVLCDFGLSRILPESAVTSDQTPFARDVRQAVALIRRLVTGCDRESVPVPSTVSASARTLLTSPPPPTVSQLVLAEWFTGPSEPLIEGPDDASSRSGSRTSSPPSPSVPQAKPSLVQRLTQGVKPKKKKKRVYIAPRFESSSSSSSSASQSPAPNLETASSSGLGLDQSASSGQPESGQVTSAVASTSKESEEKAASLQSSDERIMYSLTGMSQAVRSHVSSLPESEEPKKPESSQ